VASMGTLLTAIALAASLVQPPHATVPARLLAVTQATPQTLFVTPPGTIQAFTQDGPVLAWFSSSTKACNAVWVLSLAIGGRVTLPDETSTARNVTCRWDVSPPVNLALAGPDVLWTLRETQAALPFDYVLGAGIKDRRERRFQEVAHARRGPGLWLGGIAGGTVGTGPQAVSTLVYGVASVQYVDEIACLSGGSCLLQIAGGGVYRVNGRKQLPSLIPDTRAAVAVSVSGSALAYVPAVSTSDQGVPLAAADQPIEIVDVDTGALLAPRGVLPQGTPVAIALTPHVLVSLERTADGLKLAWYSATSGAGMGSVGVPAGTAPEVSANDDVAVFRVGRFLHVLTFATGHSRTVARTVGIPVGVSLDGSRLAWAENIHGHGRIRALNVSGAP
jgi:hypothetical protein